MIKSCSKRFNHQRAAIGIVAMLLLAAIYVIVTDRLGKLDAARHEVEIASSQMEMMNATRENLANEISLNAEQSEGKLALLFFMGKKESRIPVYGEMDKHNAALDLALKRITPLLTRTEQKIMLSRLEASRETFRDNMQETVNALELNDREKAETLLSTSIRENLQEIRGLIKQLIKEQQSIIADQQREALEQKNEAEAALSRSRQIFIVLGSVSGIIVVLLGLVLSRRVLV